MIIYNVTIKVEADIADEWIHWMKNTHMRDLMNTGLFTDCRLCRLLEHDEADGVTCVAQYFCEGMEQYNTYLSKYAEGVREQFNTLFSGKTVAFRTLMEVL